MRLEDKISILQEKLLRLKNNFNLRGALEFSLDDYKDAGHAGHLSKSGKVAILKQLMQTPEYQTCLGDITQSYQLRAADVNSCAEALYHELSKHAHGNTKELEASDKEHSITELAAIEVVFRTLKVKGTFKLPMKITIEDQEHTF